MGVKSVSAVVAAYNEEKTIMPIVDTLLKHPRLAEVIVVDDGSTDNTNKIIQKIDHPKLITVRHPKNRGKGAAVVTGLEKSDAKIFLLIDADLYQFHPVHVDILLNPLEIDPFCMAIGVIEGRRTDKIPRNVFFKPFSGERAVPRKLIWPLRGKIARSGYGIEAILNLNQMHRNRKIYYVPLPGLIHPLKFEKHPVYQYIKDYLKENTEVIKQYLDPENKVWETILKQISRKLQI